MSTPLHRPAVLDWLVPTGDTVLDLASGSSGFVRALIRHRPDLAVMTLDRDPTVGRRLAHDGHVVASAESLPIATQSVDVVTTVQSFHRFSPQRVLDEAARVLRPDGLLAISYTVRDDSVPWVRRFAELVRRRDPAAMQGEWGQSSLAALSEHPCFHPAETHDFAAWVPASPDTLVEMVMNRPAIAALTEDEQQQLRTDITDLYRNMSRGNQQLVLPYRVRCWRAHVNPTAVPHHPRSDDAALHIRL